MNQCPMYFSNTLFPIYKYNPRINDIEEHYGPTVALIIGLILVIFWGWFTNYQLKPEWLGTVIAIGI